jgi:hypothetical protein
MKRRYPFAARATNLPHLYPECTRDVYVARFNKQFYKHHSRIDPSIICLLDECFGHFCRARSAKRECWRRDSESVSHRWEQTESGEGNAKQRAQEWRYESPPTRPTAFASIIPARAYEMLFNLSSSRSDFYLFSAPFCEVSVIVCASCASTFYICHSWRYSLE